MGTYIGMSDGSSPNNLREGMPRTVPEADLRAGFCGLVMRHFEVAAYVRSVLVG